MKYTITNLENGRWSLKQEGEFGASNTPDLTRNEVIKLLLDMIAPDLPFHTNEEKEK